MVEEYTQKRLKELLTSACHELMLESSRRDAFHYIPEVRIYWQTYLYGKPPTKEDRIKRKQVRLQEACDQASKLQGEIETLENGS